MRIKVSKSFATTGKYRIKMKTKAKINATERNTLSAKNIKRHVILSR